MGSMGLFRCNVLVAQVCEWQGPPAARIRVRGLRKCECFLQEGCPFQGCALMQSLLQEVATRVIERATEDLPDGQVNWMPLGQLIKEEKLKSEKDGRILVALCAEKQLGCMFTYNNKPVRCCGLVLMLLLRMSKHTCVWVCVSGCMCVYQLSLPEGCCFSMAICCVCMLICCPERNVRCAHCWLTYVCVCGVPLRVLLCLSLCLHSPSTFYSVPIACRLQLR